MTDAILEIILRSQLDIPEAIDLIKFCVLQTANLLRELKNWLLVAFFTEIKETIQRCVNVNFDELLSISLNNF